MQKSDLIPVLRRELAAVKSLRLQARMDAQTDAARCALKRFQSARLSLTHADLLAAPDTGAAAEFFLQELYSPQDLTQRDSDVERIIPTLERLLPVAALQAITDAVTLDALSEQMDAAMAQRLGEQFDEAQYLQAYFAVTTHEQRSLQITLVQELGLALCDLVRIRFLATTLKMMRGPARLANLHHLQAFLERGFATFKAMRAPHAFVHTIVRRERQILARIIAGDPAPYAMSGLQLDAQTPPA
ncbi:hypothetical protein V8J88_10530 [Massilia sp. W12]|uniref:FFLEELY motif protein n=1 Tax=Massilia sp. W12 TaxID=3126507 RepID=UPI0030CABC3A